METFKAFTKIGETYFIDNEVQQSLVIDEESTFLTNKYDLNHFGNDNIIYLPCICQNQSFASLLESYPRQKILDGLKSKMIAQLAAIKHIGVSLDKAHLFIPSALLLEFNAELLDGMKYAFSRSSWPSDYRFLRYALGVSAAISCAPIIHDEKVVRILLNPFTAFGRFGLMPGSYNILSDSRESRKKLKPISDDFVFVEFDFNAYEIRTLLALCKIKQPEEDLYSILHKQNGDSLSRKDFKQHLIASLYSNNPEKTPLGEIIKKRKLKERFPIKNGKMTNLFGKTMQCDEYHFYSRLLQSSAAYILFMQMFNLIKFLKTFAFKSFVSFCIHDSICMQVHKDELDSLLTFQSIIENVEIEELDNYCAKFMVKTKIGENYESMEEASA